MASSTVDRISEGTGANLLPARTDLEWNGPVASGAKLIKGCLAGVLKTDTTTNNPGLVDFVGDGTVAIRGFVDLGCDATGLGKNSRPCHVVQRTGTLTDKNSGGGSAITIADVGKVAYGADNQTCSKLPTDGEPIGVIAGIDADTGSPVVGAGPTFLAMAAQIANGKATVDWTFGIVPTSATQGTDTACSNGDIYWAPVYVSLPTVVTGIQFLIGSVGGTDKAIAALYSAGGVLIANSATAGTTVGTAANMQQLALTAPVAVAPGLYYIAMQFNGTTAKFRTVATFAGMAGGAAMASNSVAGTFGTLAAITPGTTFTGGKGPIASTY